jgi:DHA3 family tetracycline resistance protein-like MFS transporter
VRQPLTERIGVLRPLQHRDFRLLWLGQTVSFIGDGIYVVAMAWLVYEDLDASPAVFAAVGIAWALPQVLLLLATGALSDRMDRRHLMIAGDLLRLGAIGAIGSLALLDALTVPILVTLVVPYGVGAALFGPSFHAIVPTIVPEEHLVAANSIGQVVRPLALTVIGPVLGGLLLYFGTGWAFVADAATFAVGAWCVWLMRVRPSREATEQTDLWADIKEGVRYVRSQAWIFYGLVIGAVSLFCVWGPWETLMPFVVKEDLGGSGIQLAIVFAAGGVGSVTVGLTMAQRKRLPRRAFTIMYLSWAVGMGMTAFFGLVTQVWQAMIVAFVAEGSIALLVVLWFTALQRLVPNELLGRVTSLDWMISIGLLPLSFAVVGPLATSIGADATLILAGVLGAASVLVILLIPASRQPERDGSLAAAEPSAVAP